MGAKTFDLSGSIKLDATDAKRSVEEVRKSLNNALKSDAMDSLGKSATKLTKEMNNVSDSISVMQEKLEQASRMVRTDAYKSLAIDLADARSEADAMAKDLEQSKSILESANKTGSIAWNNQDLEKMYESTKVNAEMAREEFERFRAIGDIVFGENNWEVVSNGTSEAIRKLGSATEYAAIQLSELSQEYVNNGSAQETFANPQSIKTAQEYSDAVREYVELMDSYRSRGALDENAIRAKEQALSEQKNTVDQLAQSMSNLSESEKWQMADPAGAESATRSLDALRDKGEVLMQTFNELAYAKQDWTASNQGISALSQEMQDIISRIREIRDTLASTNEKNLSDLQETVALEREESQLMEQLRQHLRDMGKSDAFANELVNAQKMDAELESMLTELNAVKDAIKQLKQEQNERKSLNIGLGNEAFDKTLGLITELEAREAQLNQQISEYVNRQKEATPEMQRQSELLQAIRDGAGEINPEVKQWLTDLKGVSSELMKLRARQNELKEAGVGLGYEEYDRNLGVIRQLEATQGRLNQRLSEYANKQRDVNTMSAEQVRLMTDIVLNAGQINPEIKELVVEYDRVKKELEQIVERQKELEAAGRGLGYAEYDSNLRTMAMLQQEQSQLVQGIEEYRAKQSNISRGTDEIAQKTATWKDLVSEIKSVWSATTNVIKQVGTAVHNVTSLFAKIGNHIKEMVSNIKLFNSHAEHAHKPWYKTAWTIAKALIGVRGLYMLVRKLRTAIVAGFQNLAKESIEAQMQLNLLKAKFLQLKNSVAAALAPLAAQIAPVIQRIIDLFTQAFNAVAMFFGALTGKSSVKVAKILDASYGADDESSSGSKGKTAEEKYNDAVKKAEEKYQKDLAKYNEKVAKAEQRQAEADAKLTDSKEKLNKQLQGFDELNNLTSNDLDDSADAYKDYLADIGEPPELEMPDMEDYLDNSGAGAAAKTMFEDMPIDDFFKDLADRFKDFFSPLLEAWNEVGPRIKQSWHDLVFWMKQLLSDVWNDFLTVWKSDTMVQVWKNILNIIADILDIATVLVQKIREAWNYNDNGLRFLENLAKILETITHWVDTTLRDIKTYIEENISLIPLFDSITANSASLIQVFDALGGILHDFIMEVLMPLGEWVLEDGLPQLIDLFTKLNNDIDWDTLRERLSTLWQKLEPFAEAIGQGLIDFIGEITQKVADFVNSEEFGDFLDKLGDWLDSVEPQDITQLAEAITNLLVAISGFKLLNIGGIVSSIGKLFATLAGAKLLFGGAGAGGGGLLASLFGGGASGAGATGLTAAGATAGAGMGESLLGGFVGFLKGAGSTLMVAEGAKALTPVLGKFFDKDLGDRLESKYSGFGSLIRFAGDAVSAVKQRMEGGFQNMSLKPFSDKTFDVMWHQNTLRASGNPYEQTGLAELPFYIKNITTSDEALADALSRVQEHGQIYTSDQLKQMEKMGIDVSQVAQAMRETNPEIQEFTNQLVKATGNQELFKVFGADALVYKAALDKMNDGVIDSEQAFNKYISTMERGTDRTFTMKDAMFEVLSSMSTNTKLINNQEQSIDALNKTNANLTNGMVDASAVTDKLASTTTMYGNTAEDVFTKTGQQMNLYSQNLREAEQAEQQRIQTAAQQQMMNNNLIGDYTEYNEKLRESAQALQDIEERSAVARRPSPFDEEFADDTQTAMDTLKEVPTALDEVNTALDTFSETAGTTLAESFGTLSETIVTTFSETFTTKFEEFKTTTTETLTLWVTDLQTQLSETFLTQVELLMANIILYLQESYATHLEEFRLLAMQMIMDMTLAMQEQWLIDQIQWDLLIFNIITTMQNALAIYKPQLITDLLTFCNEILTNVMTALGCSGGEGGQEGGGGHSTKFYDIMVQCLQGFIDAVAEKGPEALEVIGEFCGEVAGYFESIGAAATGAVESVKAAMTALASLDFGDLGTSGFSISSSGGGFTFKVPGLAEGTVVPPNAQRFIAMLGDNNKEAEIVSPLSTMTQAMTQALSNAGFNNGGNGYGDIVINMDGYEIFRVVRQENEKYRMSTGMSGF